MKDCIKKPNDMDLAEFISELESLFKSFVPLLTLIFPCFLLIFCIKIVEESNKYFATVPKHVRL